MKRLSTLILILLCTVSCRQKVGDMTILSNLPEIWPDYVDVTVPVGIAPLNFGMADESFDCIDVSLTTEAGPWLRVQGRDHVEFPIREWHSLLESAAGADIKVQVVARNGGRWLAFKAFHIHVSPDPIDWGLNYRLITPGYQNYAHMGIYERDLSCFDEHPLLENTQFGGCLNCHCYNRCDPSEYSIHVRGDHGATLLKLDGELAAYDTKTDSTTGFCVYPYWHPSGDYIIYSANHTRQTFHVGQGKVIEVFDDSSDLQVYDTRANALVLSPSVRRADKWETFPTFSPDGGTVYFCAADTVKLPVNIR